MAVVTMIMANKSSEDTPTRLFNLARPPKRVLGENPKSQNPGKVSGSPPNVSNQFGRYLSARIGKGRAGRGDGSTPTHSHRLRLWRFLWLRWRQLAPTLDGLLSASHKPSRRRRNSWNVSNRINYVGDRVTFHCPSIELVAVLWSPDWNGGTLSVTLGYATFMRSGDSDAKLPLPTLQLADQGR